MENMRLINRVFTYRHVWATVTVLLNVVLGAHAQGYKVSGQLVDKADSQPMMGVTVLLVNSADTNLKTGAVSGDDGSFELMGVAPARYSLRVSYLGYKGVKQVVQVVDADVVLGAIKMESEAKQLKGVTIAGKQIRAEQKGDTSQFRADAFKTNPDATAEELVTKMPGVTSDANGVKVNGETVQQVLVDGKPFFGTDPSLALKNLPAEVIDKIQVFDRLSDQSAFTGFDDGNAQKTLNIITKSNKSQGVFGRVYAGYGTDDRYIAGANLNIFDGDRRISILGLSNNINQQNFSTEDILGAVGSGGQGRSGGGSRGGRGGQGGGGGANNFMVGQQGGIARTNALGLNYSDNWGKKIKVTGSYFYNNTNTVNTSEVSRNYFTGALNNTAYNQLDTTESNNGNHRVNMRMEYIIDSSNSITFTPSFSMQNNESRSSTFAGTQADVRMLSATNNSNYASNDGYNGSANLLYQHKFGKPRRTISLNLNGGLNEKNGVGDYYSLNRFYDTVTVDSIRDQRWDQYTNGVNYNANITYTEPVGKKGQVMVNYNPGVTQNSTDKATYDRVPGQEVYADVRTSLFSNQYENTYTTQKGGLSYRLGERGGKQSFNVGVQLQEARLNGEQVYPTLATINRSFTNVLPNLFFNKRYEDGRNLRIMYRTGTNAPSISQLQTVVDVSNPLLMKTGNAALDQTYEHTFIVRYGATNSKTAKNFFFNLFVNRVENYVATATYLPARDSLFTDPISSTSIVINAGSQLSRPVNLDGYWNTRLFATYGVPLKQLKSNLNFNGGLNFNRTPGLVNDNINYSEAYVPSFGLVLSSNISENVDFTLSYTGNYNVVKNSIQTQANNNYYNHVAAARVNWIFFKNFVFNTSVTHNYFTAFSGSGAQRFLLWNSYVGYKFMKKAMEARISVYDMLNQNTSVTRTVAETYIENTNTMVLQQYFMAQLTYTIRSFKGKAPKMETEARREFDGPPPGMMPGGGMPPNSGGPSGF